MYKLDYSKVKTEEDLLEWAMESFDLPPIKQDKLINNSKSQTVLWQIWDKFVEAGDKEVVIFESYPRHQTKEVLEILNGTEKMDGWKSILGFHFYREHFIWVRFEQDPETKGKRPKKANNKLKHDAQNTRAS